MKDKTAFEQGELDKKKKKTVSKFGAPHCGPKMNPGVVRSGLFKRLQVTSVTTICHIIKVVGFNDNLYSNISLQTISKLNPETMRWRNKFVLSATPTQETASTNETRTIQKMEIRRQTNMGQTTQKR
jgi:hypothetical protein|uniref:Uncharacterized protein n=1 Tax=Eutreptiella gymnastica TaxID=73025 RepID=A0A7S4G512_9EUGL